MVLCVAPLCLIFFLLYHTTGTGGTVAGVGRYVKSKNPDVKVVLADPTGSGLYNKVRECSYWVRSNSI